MTERRTDREPIATILERCLARWEAAGLDEDVRREMAAELEQHLREALAEGKAPERVVGPDVDGFADLWAAEVRRVPAARLPTWEGYERLEERRRSLTLVAWLSGISVVLIVIAALLTSGEGSDTVDDIWRWIWIGVAVTLAVGEVLTAGFFLLPFAVGAIVAALFAWLGLSLTVQWIAFIVISAVTLYLLQTFVRKEEVELLPIGANRLLHQRAIVLETIDRRTGTGRVRLDTEEWRATTDRDEPIPAGTEVVVVGVTGARLIVEPVGETSP